MILFSVMLRILYLCNFFFKMKVELTNIKRSTSIKNVVHKKVYKYNMTNMFILFNYILVTIDKFLI